MVDRNFAKEFYEWCLNEVLDYIKLENQFISTMKRIKEKFDDQGIKDRATVIIEMCLENLRELYNEADRIKKEIKFYGKYKANQELS